MVNLFTKEKKIINLIRFIYKRIDPFTTRLIHESCWIVLALIRLIQIIS